MPNAGKELTLWRACIDDPWWAKKSGVIPSSENVTLLPGMKLVPCSWSVPPGVIAVLPFNKERPGDNTVRPILVTLVMISMAAKTKISHTGAQPPGFG